MRNYSHSEIIRCPRCGIDRVTKNGRDAHCRECFYVIRRESAGHSQCVTANCRRTARHGGLCNDCHRLVADDTESPVDISGWHRAVRGGVVRWIEPQQVAS